MTGNDENLSKDLRAAAGRGLPGEAFDRRVMETIEGGGGERILSIEPGPSRWRGLRLSAAVLLLAVGVWAVASGQFRREGTGDAGTAGAALPSDIELPRAVNSDAWPEPLRVEVTHDEKIRIGGRTVDLAGLRRALLVATEGTHSFDRASRPSERPFVLFADRQVRWRMVQWVLQTCADPEVRLYKLHFAVAGKDGVLRVMPTFLPIDRSLVRSDRPFDGGKPIKRGLGQSDRPFDGAKLVPGEIEEEVIKEDDSSAPAGEFREELIEEPFQEGDWQRLQLKLRREPGGRRTTYSLNGQPIETRDECRRRLHLLLKDNAHQNLEIDGSADVPYGDVIFVLDSYAARGKASITFVGAPPPKSR